MIECISCLFKRIYSKVGWSLMILKALVSNFNNISLRKVVCTLFLRLASVVLRLVNTFSNDCRPGI